MPDESKKTFQQPEVVAFCALIARIMVRCLREKNPSIMRLLSSSSQQQEMETRETHDAA